MLIPVIINDGEKLKFGDVFTINPDYGDAPGDMVRGKTFIAVPHNYESRSLRKIWSERIKKEEIKLKAGKE